MPFLSVNLTFNGNLLSKIQGEKVMEIAKVTSRGQITLPLAIRKKLEVQEGDKVIFYEENGRIVVENAAKLTVAPRQNSSE